MFSYLLRLLFCYYCDVCINATSQRSHYYVLWPSRLHHNISQPLSITFSQRILRAERKQTLLKDSDKFKIASETLQ